MFFIDIYWLIFWSYNIVEEVCILVLCLLVMFVCKSIDLYFLWIMIYVEVVRFGLKWVFEGIVWFIIEFVFFGEDMILGFIFNFEDFDLYYVYVCIKVSIL